jgi:hypothetical protein
MGALGRFYCILVAFVGCASPPHRGAGGATSSSPARPAQYYVTEAALRYELGQHSADQAERDRYSGYILDCGEFTDDLVGALSGYTPPVIVNAMMADNGGDLIDSATGKHIKVWKVRVEELHRNVAKAYVFWTCTGFRFGSGSHTVMLQRKQGCWQVTSEHEGCTP